MAAWQVVIAQGDEAGRFHVIAEGTVEVTQVLEGDGEPDVLCEMVTGEAFGEIGLVSGVPRTDTVAAVSDGTLLALDKGGLPRPHRRCDRPCLPDI